MSATQPTSAWCQQPNVALTLKISVCLQIVFEVLKVNINLPEFWIYDLGKQRLQEVRDHSDRGTDMRIILK
jgi:hypothetical protein